MLVTLRVGQKLPHFSAANSYRYDESWNLSKAFKLFFVATASFRRPSYICRRDE